MITVVRTQSHDFIFLAKLTMTQLIPGLKALILDMDGVIWRGDQPLGDLPVIFAEFKRRGYQTILATNNATLSDDQYLVKLQQFGVELEEWQIISSPDVAANYLRKTVSRWWSGFFGG